MDKYDVFISCKSEDYAYAEAIYSFLRDNGINAFLTSKELRKLGESEYRSAITSVLKEVTHIIVFASKAEYVDSRWVYYEWDWFVNAKLKGFKQGNIVTVLKDVAVESINADLWKYESLTFDNFRDSIIRYVATEQSRQRLTEKRLKQREQQKRLEMMKQLEEQAVDYKQAAYGLDIKGHKLEDMERELGLQRVCPVCGSAVKPGKAYCGRCAWSMSPIDGIADLAYLSSVDREQLALHKRFIQPAASAPVAAAKHPAHGMAKAMAVLAAILAVALAVCLYQLDQRGTGSRKAERELRELREERRQLEERQLRESALDSLFADGPVLALNIKVRDRGGDYGESIYASAATFITHSAVLLSDQPVNGDVYVKFISPDGLSIGSDSPAGYSYKQHVSLSPMTPLTLESPGWGLDVPGNWTAGDYRVEYWYKGRCIGTHSFRMD